MRATSALACMQMGRHVYVERQRTRTSRNAAAYPGAEKYKVATQMGLQLGSAAVHYDGKLLWDNAKGEFTNNREANKWVKPAFRKGWEIKV